MPAIDATPAEDLALIASAAAEAGRIALGFFKHNPEVWMKGGTSPVSEADYAVDRYLRESLTAARPDYGWLSEETADNDNIRHVAAQRTFVVDPIDGTRAFLDGRSTWCVSIAVVEEGAPLAGVLDCPAKQEVFVAAIGGGATKNGRSLTIGRPGLPVRVAGPKPMLDELVGRLDGPVERVAYIPSLAYRIAMVADGAIDATFIKSGSHDWDLAAAELILTEAGGRLCEPTGQRPVYASASPRHGVLAAGSGTLLDSMVAAMSISAL